MASSTKSARTSQAPTSPQPQIPPTPEDPLVVAAVEQVEAMDDMQMARAAGQILYDLAIQDPTITVATPAMLGMILKTTLRNDNGKLFPEYLPLIRQYLQHSLVAKDPRLVAVAICRIVTVQLYAAGKLQNNADPTDRAGLE